MVPGAIGGDANRLGESQMPVVAQVSADGIAAHLLCVYDAVLSVDQDVHGNETCLLRGGGTDKGGKACEVPTPSANHSIDSRLGEGDCEPAVSADLRFHGNRASKSSALLALGSLSNINDRAV